MKPSTIYIGKVYWHGYIEGPTELYWNGEKWKNKTGDKLTSFIEGTVTKNGKGSYSYVSTDPEKVKLWLSGARSIKSAFATIFEEKKKMNKNNTG